MIEKPTYRGRVVTNSDELASVLSQLERLVQGGGHWLPGQVDINGNPIADGPADWINNEIGDIFEAVENLVDDTYYN